MGGADDNTATAGHNSSAQKPESDAVYEPGNGVTTPKLLHYVEPEFSSSSKEAFVDGVVRISLVVKRTGEPGELHVVKGLNTEEDHQAVAAVKQWRFAPGTKDGQPVTVRVTVEVEFHLL